MLNVIFVLFHFHFHRLVCLPVLQSASYLYVRTSLVLTFLFVLVVRYFHLLLEESSMSGGTSDIGPIKRNAILIRARERRILQTSIYKLNQRRRSLLHFSYQITEVREKENKSTRIINSRCSCYGCTSSSRR